MSIIILLFSSTFLFLIDDYSFYPVRTEFSFFKIPDTGRTKPVITKEQYDIMNWVKNRSTAKDVVIVSPHLWGYTMLIFWGMKFVVYEKIGIEHPIDQQMAYDLVWRTDFFEAIKYFSTNFSNVWIILSRNYDQESRQLISELENDPIFPLVLENDVTVVFRLDIEQIEATLENMVSKAFLRIINNNHTSSENLVYGGSEGTTIYMTLDLIGSNKYNITNIPAFLSFESISPKSERIIIDANRFIYFEGKNKINYTIKFTSIFPYENIGWKEDSFLSGWFTNRNATLTSNGDITSVQVDKLYDAIYRRISVNSSEYRYLIIKYKVNFGNMEIKIMSMDGTEFGFGSTSNSNWTIKIYDLWKIKKGIFKSIKIQGNIVPSNYDIDYIMFTSMQ